MAPVSPALLGARVEARRMGLRDVLASVVEAFRRDDAKTPVVLMGYANPIERMGHAGFRRCERAVPASMAC